ncbi:MAG: septal ring lytic transglycosylase RlpA family protein [Acidobacteriaceae bacterium]
MEILDLNSTLNVPDGPLSVRRAASIAAGLFCGITLSLHGIQPNRGAASVLAEAAPANSRPASAKAAPLAAPAKKLQDWHQIGLASWYGPQFQGKETADGETFNMYDLTCAHRSLPLGTWVKVTNLRTRKWIVVRVNDRGPVPDTRIADLSSEAAHMLGMRARGVTRVRLDVIDPKAAVEIARLDRIRMARQAAEQSTTDAGD